MQDLIKTVTRTPLELRPDPRFPDDPSRTSSYLSYVARCSVASVFGPRRNGQTFKRQNAQPVSCMHPAWAGSVLFPCTR